MGVTVEYNVHRIAAERFFQPARAQIGIDLEWFTRDRSGDG
jgi:hypothetical protein